MLRRLSLLFVLIFVSFNVFAQVSAPPRDQTQAAVLADMSRRTGETVTINSLGYQQWHYGTYDFVRSLGCPAAPQTPTASGNWQRFVFNYHGFDYIYLVSDNLQSLILCNEANLPTAIAPTAQATATQQGTGQSGGGVGATATPTFTSGDFGNLPTATLQGSGQSGGGVGTGGDNPVVDAICLLPQRLEIGSQGRVTPGDPNWLHQEPGRSSTKIGEIPPGAQFTVLGGAVCDLETGMNYWQVNYNGLIGWTSEGLDGEYWLEPLVNTFSSETVNNAFVPDWANTISGTALVALSPQGVIAYTTSDTELTVIQLSDNSSLGSMSFNAAITSLEYHLGGFYLTIGLANGELNLAENLPNVHIREMYPHEGAITDTAINADNSILAVADDAAILTFWSIGTNDAPLRRIQLPEAAGSIEFSVDNRLLLVRDVDGNFLTALQVP